MSKKPKETVPKPTPGLSFLQMAMQMTTICSFIWQPEKHTGFSTGL